MQPKRKRLVVNIERFTIPTKGLTRYENSKYN